MPQFGASLTDDSRRVIYNHIMFILQATGANVKTLFNGKLQKRNFLSLPSFISKSEVYELS